MQSYPLKTQDNEEFLEKQRNDVLEFEAPLESKLTIRYGGKDEIILKRLYEMGLEEECDHKPIGKYKMVVRNKVAFQYQGLFKRLAS